MKMLSLLTCLFLLYANFALAAEVTVDPTFGINGAAAVPAKPFGIVETRRGDIFVASRTANGDLVTKYDDRGRKQDRQSISSPFKISTMRALGNDGLIVAGETESVFAAYRADGTLNPYFGDRGVLRLQGSGIMAFAVVNGSLYAANRIGTKVEMVSFSSRGEPNQNFRTYLSASFSPTLMEYNPRDGRLYVFGNQPNYYGYGTSMRIYCVDLAGNADQTFGDRGMLNHTGVHSTDPRQVIFKDGGLIVVGQLYREFALWEFNNRGQFLKEISLRDYSTLGMYTPYVSMIDGRPAFTSGRGIQYLDRNGEVMSNFRRPVIRAMRTLAGKLFVFTDDSSRPDQTRYILRVLE